MTMDPFQSVMHDLYSLMNFIQKNGGWWLVAGWIVAGGIWVIFMIFFGRRGAPS